MIIDKSLCFSDNREIDAAYIIALKGNAESEKLATRCLQSCVNIDMPVKIWQAFDGTDNVTVKVPEHLENKDHLLWLKRLNDKYSTSQLACFFSHYSLWAHCATIDKPIIILEHDAVMVKPLRVHNFYNAIHYLGSKEQTLGAPVYATPPHGSIYSGNWRFICRAHAYAIDPPIARNLIAYAIREGITKTLDVFMRCDIFSIIQDGIYAYDERGISTINELEDYTKDC